MMEEILIGAVFGIAGGLTRLLVSLIKSVKMRKTVSPTSFLSYALVLIVIGAFSGIVLSYGKALSFLAGYAALDLLDGYYKTFKGKKIKLNVK